MRALARLCGSALLVGALVGVAGASPTLRLCTGKKGNNYFAVGQLLAEKLAESTRVELIETEGSWANLAGIDAEPAQCDAIIAQDDAAALYAFENPQSKLMMERVGALYPEFVHVLCDPSVKVARVADLDPAQHKMLVNTYGSGTYVTWKLMGRLNPAYAKLPVTEVGLDEGLLAVANGRAGQCLVAVSGVSAGAGRIANDKFAGRVKLLSLADASLHRAVGREKKAVYQTAVIAASTYPGLLAADLTTQRVVAVFFLSPEWRARHPEEAKTLTETLPKLVEKLPL